MILVFLSFFNCCFLLDLFWLLNIKLVRNWASWFNWGLWFNGLRVWDLFPSLEDSSRISWVFFSLFKVDVFFFHFYRSSFISLMIRLFFFFLSISLLYDFFNHIFFVVYLFLVCLYINLFSLVLFMSRVTF